MTEDAAAERRQPEATPAAPLRERPAGEPSQHLGLLEGPGSVRSQVL
jgi:hypothetical protein